MRKHNLSNNALTPVRREETDQALIQVTKNLLHECKLYLNTPIGSTTASIPPVNLAGDSDDSSEDNLDYDPTE